MPTINDPIPQASAGSPSDPQAGGGTPELVAKAPPAPPKARPILSVADAVRLHFAASDNFRKAQEACGQAAMEARRAFRAADIKDGEYTIDVDGDSVEVAVNWNAEPHVRMKKKKKA